MTPTAIPGPVAGRHRGKTVVAAARLDFTRLSGPRPARRRTADACTGLRLAARLDHDLGDRLPPRSAGVFSSASPSRKWLTCRLRAPQSPLVGVEPAHWSSRAMTRVRVAHLTLRLDAELPESFLGRREQRRARSMSSSMSPAARLIRRMSGPGPPRRPSFPVANEITDAVRAPAASRGFSHDDRPAGPGRGRWTRAVTAL